MQGRQGNRKKRGRNSYEPQANEAPDPSGSAARRWPPVGFDDIEHAGSQGEDRWREVDKMVDRVDKTKV
jgi:hypothetical protein